MVVGPPPPMRDTADACTLDISCYHRIGGHLNDDIYHLPEAQLQNHIESRTLWDSKEGDRNNCIPMSTPDRIVRITYRQIQWVIFDMTSGY
jgi:hypothetical protein